ncbi:hypothetical protein [Leisingera caerulea]|uniref:hypothetical protein n=1 Tax=Leisingera caerulea TaxID=506591 RepID=UPI0021A4E6BE|nr:hypothetical protein [Leisingera caerulea]UWQ83125.1 hypothetical protein K3726_15890 [Leisingera caerulea]
MAELPVKKLPNADSGRQIVRLNYRHRSNIDRYGIAKITNTENAKSFLVLMLGHDDEDAIYMPYDIRRALGVDSGAKLSFTLEKAGRFGKLLWYITADDPAVHVPAWIALIGIAVGLMGVIVGALSLI